MKAILAILLVSLTPLVRSWIAGPACSIHQNLLQKSILLAKSSKDGDDTDSEDWRDFRAKLVLGEKLESSSSTSDDSSPWAYDAGDVIEKGSIILSSLEQVFGHGLNQQYFHKSVILVLEHDENVFTKGVILNRPTDLFLADEDFMLMDGSTFKSGKKNKWRVWYGGDVQWITSKRPELVCLHSLQSDAAREVSESVLKDHVVQYTSLEQAYKLIVMGEAKCEDFYLCGGYCGWGPGQLQGELERKSWHMVAADAQTVWEELRARQEDTEDITGESTWTRLMERIGRGEETKASNYGKEFDDKMLALWAKTNLVFNNNDDEKKAKKKIPVPKIGPGTLLRGSSSSDSPFLLSDQGFHESIILVTQDDEDFTLGVMLNRPSSRTIKLDFPDDDFEVSVPARYGGKYTMKGVKTNAAFWYHNNDQLRAAKVGTPLGEEDGIWRCTEKQVRAALRDGIAGEKDFLCVKGLSIWPKARIIGSTLVAFTQRGHFEVVPKSQFKDVWKHLASQETLTSMTLDRNIMLGKAAWKAASDESSSVVSSDGGEASQRDQRDLADEALRRWMDLFLLENLPGEKKTEESAFE